ncbi:MAG: hypothetical protein ACYDCL_14325 [Myxococcales bacterium]
MPENPTSQKTEDGPPAEEQEVELSLAHYFGGYAIIFFGVIGFALVLVAVMKLMR